MITTATRRLIVGILLCATVIVGVGIKSATAATQAGTRCGAAAPKFSGTFLQPWLADSWTPKNWSTEFQLMREVCINTLILQWTADSQQQTTVYPSGLAGYTQNTNHDVVAEALQWADRYNIHVYLGLNEDGDWWSKYASDRPWFMNRMQVGAHLVSDLWSRYGQYHSLAGWYIALEPWNSATNPTVQSTLAEGYSLVTKRAHSLTHLPVMIAPFYNTSFGQTPKEWTTTWTWLLRHAPIDIIALQDGVGAAHATTRDLSSWFGATARAIRASRSTAQLWSDTETYTIANYEPMPINHVIADIKAVTPYVNRLTSFSFNHYISPQQVNPAFYATYRYYARAGQQDHTPPSTPASLTASTSTTTQLSWKPSHDNFGVVAYDIYRDGKLLTRCYTCKSSFDDNTEPSGNSPTYQVAAVDAAGNRSALSAPASAR